MTNVLGRSQSQHAPDAANKKQKRHQDVDKAQCKKTKDIKTKTIAKWSD